MSKSPKQIWEEAMDETQRVHNRADQQRWITGNEMAELGEPIEHNLRAGDPVVKFHTGWYFLDETGTKMYGAFRNEAEAREVLERYAASLTDEVVIFLDKPNCACGGWHPFRITVYQRGEALQVLSEHETLEEAQEEFERLREENRLMMN